MRFVTWFIVGICLGAIVPFGDDVASADEPCSCTQACQDDVIEQAGGVDVLVCPDADIEPAPDAMEALLAETPHEPSPDGLTIIRFPKGTLRDSINAFQTLADTSGLRRVIVEPHHVAHPLNPTPSDKWFPSQWSLNNTNQDEIDDDDCVADADINALEAWAAFGKYDVPGDEKILIGMIESNVNPHPDLVDNLWTNPLESTGGSGVDDDANGYKDDVRGIDGQTRTGIDLADLKNPDDSHGTGVASIIAAVGNNDDAMAGVTWKARLVPCQYWGDDRQLVRCLRYLIRLKDEGANIVAVNLSWGSKGCSCCVEREIRRLRQRGILLVAGAGDAGTDNDQGCGVFPASNRVSNIISVAASTCADDRPSDSNYGKRTVHVAAPGAKLPSLHDGASMVKESMVGATSAATPHVTGLIGLLKAQDMGRDWRILRNLVLAGGTAGLPAFTDSTITGRRIRAWDTNGTGSMSCVNQSVRRRLLPVADTVTQVVGSSLPIVALNVTCATSDGTVPVKVFVNEGGTLTALQDLELHDDGVAPDEVAGDGEAAGAWKPTTPGMYTLTLWNGDADSIDVAVHEPAPTPTPGP